MKTIFKSILVAGVLLIGSSVSQAWAWGCQDYGYTVYESNGQWMSTMDPVKAVHHMATFSSGGTVYINDKDEGCIKADLDYLKEYTGYYPVSTQTRIHNERRELARLQRANRIAELHSRQLNHRTGGYRSSRHRSHRHYRGCGHRHHRRRGDDGRAIAGALMTIGGILLMNSR